MGELALAARAPAATLRSTVNGTSPPSVTPGEHQLRTIRRALWLAALISGGFSIVHLFHPVAWTSFWLHQAEAAIFIVAVLVVGRLKDARARTAVPALAIAVATPLVGAATAFSGQDPVPYLIFLPLTVAVILPEEPLAIGASSVASLITVGVVILRVPVSVRPSYALGVGTVIGGVSVYASVQLRRLQRLLRERAEQDMTRSTQALSAAAPRLYACRGTPQVLEVAAQALAREGLKASLLRVEGESLRLTALGSPQAPVRTLTPEAAGEALRVMATGRATYLAEGWPGDAAQGVTGESSVIVPVLVEAKPYGCLCVRSTHLPPTSAALIELFAAHVGAALENVLHHERAEQRLEELTRLQAALVARERLAALGEAAAVVAHEVRNPLGAIVNATALLRKGAGDPESHAKLVSMVEEEAMSLDRLVNDLLVLARPLTPQKRVVDLVAVVTRTCALVTGSPVVVDNEGDEHRAVLADPDQLQLALLNLLRNAAQASPAGEPIRVRLHSDGDRHVVTVEDGGPGIAAELRERIFEPFFTTRTSGTGLGLAIVKRVVDAHQGTIAVLGRERKGTRVDVTLPAAHQG